MKIAYTVKILSEFSQMFFFMLTSMLPLIIWYSGHHNVSCVAALWCVVCRGTLVCREKFEKCREIILRKI
jgi:hypothetical protein